MHHLAGACAALCFFTATASATLTSRTDAAFPADMLALIAEMPVAEPEIVPNPGEADLTADSQVYLNGKRCSYKDVPANATVERVEFGQDGKTIIRIEFRTGR